MSDHFEKAKTRILARAAENGGPTISDLLEALEATNEDLDDNHSETKNLLADHIADEEKLAEKHARAQADECARKHAELFARAPRRSGDPITADFADGEGRVAPETPAEAEESRGRFSREQIVASFWILVGLLVLSNVIPRIIDGILELIRHA